MLSSGKDLVRVAGMILNSPYISVAPEILPICARPPTRDMYVAYVLNRSLDGPNARQFG